MVPAFLDPGSNPPNGQARRRQSEVYDFDPVSLSQKIHSFKIAAQDGCGWRFKPALQDGAVDGPKIGGKADIAIQQIFGSEGGGDSVDSGSHSSPCNEQGCGRAVVRALIGIFLNPASKFTEGHQQDPVELAQGFQVCEKCASRVSQFTQQFLMSGHLMRVGVEAAMTDIKDPRPKATSDQAGNEL